MLNQDYKPVTDLEDTLELSSQLAIDVIVDNLSKDNMLDTLLQIISKELRLKDLHLVEDKEIHFITRRLMVLVFKGRSSYGDTYHAMIEDIIREIKNYQVEQLAVLIAQIERVYDLKEVPFTDLDLDMKDYILENINHYSKVVESLAVEYYSNLV